MSRLVSASLAISQVSLKQSARELRRSLHLQRLSDCAEAERFARGVQAAMQWPLEALHQHVGPYDLFRPGSDNSTETHQCFYAQHAQQKSPYHHLCKRVVSLIGEPCYVQRIPTYRFGLPQNRWVGNYHRDSDFGHSDFELNAVCALTPMAASAALHVEQIPGCRDFVPMELKAGELILFDHIDRVHGCPINREGVSVASIDFRFVPQRFASEAFCSVATSINTGTAFSPGHYFTAEPIVVEAS